MSTTSMAIFSNQFFATYSVYARNASILDFIVVKDDADGGITLHGLTHSKLTWRFFNLVIDH